MKSHFRMNRGVATACAVAGAATMLNGRCAAQPFVAADYATNSIYNGGWSAGQNGGYGFGAWSFNDSDVGTTPGTLQEITTTSAVGTAWTLMNTVYTNGISNVGRAINGGLQVGQTFQTIIQNPVNSSGIYTYRGFDILFTARSTNDPAGDNGAALRLTVFDYFNPTMKWDITDAASPPRTSLSAMTTGESGMIIDLTLDSTNTYTLSMAPVSNPNSPYLTYTGTLAVATNPPISYVNYRLWNTNSSGPTDTADNFEISSVTVQGTMLNIQAAGTNTVLSWSTNVPGFVLASSPTLNPGAVWNTNLPAPAVVGNQNFVTNPVSGPQQFYRLQLVQ